MKNKFYQKNLHSQDFNDKKSINIFIYIQSYILKIFFKPRFNLFWAIIFPILYELLFII